jgi:hypothetical protein
MPRMLMSSAGAVVVLALVPNRLDPIAAAPSTGTVYVSVLDRKGAPITDMQAADFEVKVGGKVQNVVSVATAKTPLRIALLVADAGTGAFQAGVARFMQKLLGRAEFALTSIVVQPELLVDYSPDGAKLSAAMDRIGPRGRQAGAQLLEAIDEAVKTVRHETRRPVIVVARLGGEAGTSIPGDDVREKLRKSGAILHVVSAGGPGASQVSDSQMADGVLNLHEVLGDGSKESGGRHQQVVSTLQTKALEELAEELLQQYEVTFALPERVKPAEKLGVSSKRKGVNVYARTRLAD